MTINIAIIDDHKLVLQGLTEKLMMVKDFDVIGSYSEINDFVLCLEYKKVDIIIMDLMLKDMHGFDLLKKISLMKNKSFKIVLISGFYEEILHKRAIELGANAFLNKEVSYDELIGCIYNVMNGNYIIPNFLIPESINPLLSDIEFEILELIIDELTNEQIAQKLYISRRTVETHISKIFIKLNVTSRIGAVREGLKLRI